MGGQIAIAVLPFDGGFGTSTTVPAGLDFGCTVATFARFYDFMAKPAVVTASLGGHESALTTFTNGLTNHGINSPFHMIAQKNGQISAHIWPSANL